MLPQRKAKQKGIKSFEYYRKQKEKQEVGVAKDCVICLEQVTSRGVISNCNHWFCFTCIYEWSKRTNTCPLCKQRFRCITKKSISSKGSPHKTFRIQDKDQTIEYDDDDENVMDYESSSYSEADNDSDFDPYDTDDNSLSEERSQNHSDIWVDSDPDFESPKKESGNKRMSVTGSELDSSDSSNYQTRSREIKRDLNLQTSSSDPSETSSQWIDMSFKRNIQVKVAAGASTRNYMARRNATRMSHRNAGNADLSELSTNNDINIRASKKFYGNTNTGVSGASASSIINSRSSSNLRNSTNAGVSGTSASSISNSRSSSNLGDNSNLGVSGTSGSYDVNLRSSRKLRHITNSSASGTSANNDTNLRSSTMCGNSNAGASGKYAVNHASTRSSIGSRSIIDVRNGRSSDTSMYCNINLKSLSPSQISSISDSENTSEQVTSDHDISLENRSPSRKFGSASVNSRISDKLKISNSDDSDLIDNSIPEKIDSCSEDLSSSARGFSGINTRSNVTQKDVGKVENCGTLHARRFFIVNIDSGSSSNLRRENINSRCSSNLRKRENIDSGCSSNLRRRENIDSGCSSSKLSRCENIGSGGSFKLRRHENRGSGCLSKSRGSAAIRQISNDNEYDENCTFEKAVDHDSLEIGGDGDMNLRKTLPRRAKSKALVKSIELRDPFVDDGDDDDYEVKSDDSESSVDNDSRRSSGSEQQFLGNLTKRFSMRILRNNSQKASRKTNRSNWFTLFNHDDSCSSDTETSSSSYVDAFFYNGVSSSRSKCGSANDNKSSRCIRSKKGSPPISGLPSEKSRPIARIDGAEFKRKRQTVSNKVVSAGMSCDDSGSEDEFVLVRKKVSRRKVKQNILLDSESDDSSLNIRHKSTRSNTLRSKANPVSSRNIQNEGKLKSLFELECLKTVTADDDVTMSSSSSLLTSKGAKRQEKWAISSGSDSDSSFANCQALRSNGSIFNSRNNLSQQSRLVSRKRSKIDIGKENIFGD